MSSSGNFFKGLLYGAVLGAAAGVLLAPKSGEETRDNLKKLALDTAEKADKVYIKARKEVMIKIEELKDAGKKIDVEEYKKLVAKVIDEIKTDGEVTSDVTKEIGEKLNKDWNRIKETAL